MSALAELALPGAAGLQGREEVINHKTWCPPRWAARSASFRGDGWILWEIARPCAGNGLTLLT